MCAHVLRLLILVTVLAVAGCSAQVSERGAEVQVGTDTAETPQREVKETAGGFTLTSTAFTDGARIPVAYTADGEGKSPPLAWTRPPTQMRSLALIVDDPDAPRRTFVHWVAYSIPASITSLPAGLPKDDILTQQGGLRQGTNSAGSIGYTPPDPPPGKVHHYIFHLFALDQPLKVAPRATAEELRKAMEGHIVGTAELTGTYGR